MISANDVIAALHELEMDEFVKPCKGVVEGAHRLGLFSRGKIAR